MKIEEIRNEHLDEVYYDITHPSGLKILVMPKTPAHTRFLPQNTALSTH